MSAPKRRMGRRLTDFLDEDFYLVTMEKGEPAKDFSPEARVWSEMKVRKAIFNALRKLEQLGLSDD